VLGNAAVAEYNVPYRLFSIVTVVMGFFLVPLWRRTRKANAAGGRGLDSTTLDGR